MTRANGQKKDLFALSEARPLFQYACKKLQTIRFLVTDLEPLKNKLHNAAVTFYLPVGTEWAGQAVGSLQFYGQNKFSAGFCSSIELRFYDKFLQKAPKLAEVIANPLLSFRVLERRLQYEAFHFTSQNCSDYISFIDNLTNSIQIALEKDFSDEYKSLKLMPIRESTLMLPIAKD